MSKQNASLVSLVAPRSLAGERYQALRWKLERLQESRGVRVVAVTSPCMDDGKSVTAVNLAVALAAGSSRVLLVDADLRRPSVASLLGLDAVYGVGLGDLIGDDTLTLERLLCQVETHPQLSVLLAGSQPLPVPELLRHPRFEKLLQYARTKFSFVIIDTPPLLAVNDAAVLSQVVDGMLIAVAAHTTTKRDLEHVFNQLDESKVLGIVLNGDDTQRTRQYAAYYRR
jgi:polysaccharide biosynthesis transport protein